MIKKYIIGIDLGTTNSCVSIVQNGESQVLVNASGARTTPSVVGFVHNSNDTLVGTDAINQKYGNPKNTIYEAKRLIGLSYDEFKAKQKDINLHYSVVRGSNGEAAIQLENKTIITPIQVAANVLGECKKFACKHLGLDPSHELSAVVTVPAYFNDAQRQATRDAGRIAGLNVERIINEPTAAALAYAKQNLLDKQSAKVAIYDFGGGTFDISILEMSTERDENGNLDTVLEVKSTNGDTNLGGALIDERLYKNAEAEIQKVYGLSSELGDPVVRTRIKEGAETVKKELSFKQKANISLPFLAMVNNRPVSPDIEYTRAQLDALMDPLVDRTIECCKRALSDAGLSAKDIDYVVLVGGSTRIPLVQSRVEKFFNKKPRSDINPDEVVSIGAAIQGSVLTGDVKDILLIDVTPLTLGIETQGGIFTPLISRNSNIPTEKKQTFSTAEDNQTAVTISLYQGERPMAENNHLLGRFNLDGIAPAPRGVPQIEVSIAIDVNGIISVSAQDKATNKKNHITITGDSKLSEAEIKKMMEDYKQNQAADEERKSVVEARNNLESAIRESEKMLRDHEALISEEDKTSLRNMTQESKDLLSGDDSSSAHKIALTDKHKELTSLYSKIGQKIHESGNKTANDDKDSTFTHDTDSTQYPDN